MDLSSIIDNMKKGGYVRHEPTIIKSYRDVPLTHCVEFIRNAVNKNKNITEEELKQLYSKTPVDEKLSWLYRSLAGNNYNFNANSISSLLKTLSMYFMGIKSDKYSLDKGICLMGDYGLGKTTVFDIYKQCADSLTNFPNNYRVTSIENIIDHYRERNSIRKFYYNWAEGEKPQPFHLVINEFGSEINEKIYGTNVSEIITQLMMLRYESLTHKGQPKVTHITTNFPKKYLLEHVHPKIRSRFMQMFNFFTLTGESFRK